MPEKARECVERYGGTTFDSWQQLASHRQIDLVSICGPESVRAAQAVFTCQRGKDTLCEKPLANSLLECDRMLSAAEANNVSLMTFFNMRFHPVVNAISEVLPEIGPIYALRLDYTQFRTSVGWRHRLEQRGGVLKSQGVHPIDLAMHWVGPVETVSGEMSVVHPEREVEDFALITVRFQNGAVGEIYTCYTDRQEEAMYGALHGMAGKLRFTLSPYKLELNRVLLQAGGEPRTIPLRRPDVIDPVYPGLMDCSKKAIAHFVDCVASSKPSPLDGKLGRQSIEIVLAGYESQRRGSKVKLPLGSFDSSNLEKCFQRFETMGFGLSD
jgi:predicted dehydrogenase